MYCILLFYIAKTNLSTHFPSHSCTCRVDKPASWTKADQNKLGEALVKLAEEDPTFRTSTNPETGDTIIAGMGELHLDVIVDRLKREFNVETNVGRPQVSYRETIERNADAECKYVKQTGGRGQYGHVKIKLEPLEKGKGFEPASRHPASFHGAEPFDIKTGLPLAMKKKANYTDVFSTVMVKLAARDDKVVAITAAMPDGTGLKRFRNLYPERFFDPLMS